ncbi:MAG: hypothetical protein C4308_11335 [Chitinophagaceae bacterium]
MFRILLFIFLAYLAYQFIFRFIIPVARTTREIKKGFRNMQQKMDEFSAQQQNSNSSTHTNSSKTSGEKGGEYIEFEEIK